MRIPRPCCVRGTRKWLIYVIRANCSFHREINGDDATESLHHLYHRKYLYQGMGVSPWDLIEIFNLLLPVRTIRLSMPNFLVPSLFPQVALS